MHGSLTEAMKMIVLSDIRLKVNTSDALSENWNNPSRTGYHLQHCQRNSFTVHIYCLLAILLHPNLQYRLPSIQYNLLHVVAHDLKL
jgi:hypothetical protein